ncbi:MAG: rhamnulokinase [Oscillospiraceae bacterium]|nr:rhamnulokinase [Oscillospiraceae bacterium]
MELKAHLAIDIGASGGRHILGWLEDGKLRLEEVHRFPNGMKQKDGCLYWDVEAIFSEIIAGLKKCAEIGKIPVSVGIDTWGVDFVLLDKDGNLVAPTIAYRDSRTDGMDIEVSKCISEPELYARAGIQKMLINTVYQLMAIKKSSEYTLKSAAHLLMMPDYFHYRLSGVMKNEYTIATTGALINSESKTWDDEIISRCGFPREIFGEIVPAGTILGGFTEQIKNTFGFDSTVIMPPSHDTAGAFLAVPTKSDRSVYISSGTWSLMGVELLSPITNEISRVANITNEGGYNYRYRYLKNIAGLWLLQCVRNEIGDGIDYAELVKMARKSGCDTIFDVNDDRFTSPASMVEAISEVCREAGQTVPSSIADFARSIFRSLAVSYSNTAKDLEALTGTTFESVNIIGGGSQNEFLNELTAKATGLPVYAGPTEGTALGSIAAQMISMGVLADLEDARKVIRNSFDIKFYK